MGNTKKLLLRMKANSMMRKRVNKNMPKSKIFSFFFLVKITKYNNSAKTQKRRNSLFSIFPTVIFITFMLHFFHFILEILSGLPSIISFIIYCDLFVSVAGTLDQPHP